jgi:hypothetical protein
VLVFLVLFLTLGRLYREMFKQAETRALLLMAALTLLVGIVFYTQVERWSLVDALYFCVVTLGTVGYGDITPATDFGKIFTTFYIIVGLSVIGGFLATMGRMISQGQFVTKGESLLGHRHSQSEGTVHQVDGEQSETDSVIQ